jgi:hypothetical protein
MDLIVHLGDQFIAESFSDIHKKGGIKGRPFDIGTVPQKILENLSRSSGYMFSVIWATASRSSRLSHMLDDHCTDQNSGVQSRPSGGVTFVKQTYQLVPRNMRTEHNPSVGGIQTVIEGSFKSGE